MKINSNLGFQGQINNFDGQIKSKQAETTDEKKLMEVCRDFESVFLNMVMKEMKNTVQDGGLFEKSQGTKIFEDMYLEELSNEVAKEDSGLGLAKMMFEQLNNGNVIIK